MGSSNENPKKATFTCYNFQNGKGNEVKVAPESKKNELKVEENSVLFPINVEEAPRYEIDEKTGIISFAHEKGIKTGKIKDFEKFVNRRKAQRKVAEQEAVGER